MGGGEAAFLFVETKVFFGDEGCTFLVLDILLAGDGGGDAVLVFLVPLFLGGLEDFARVEELFADVAGQGEVGPAVAEGDSGGGPGRVTFAGEDNVGEPGAGAGEVTVAGEDSVGEPGAGVGEDGNGGRSDCGGDFIKQFLTVFGLPLFLFWPRGTALTWEVTSSLPSL